MNEGTNWIIDPVIQKGFAGAAAVLLAVLVLGWGWVMKRCFARLEARDEDVSTGMEGYHDAMMKHVVAFERLASAIERIAAANEVTASKVDETNRLLDKRECLQNR